MDGRPLANVRAATPVNSATVDVTSAG